MTLSSRKRAVIALAIFLCLVTAVAGIYAYRMRRPFAPAAVVAAPVILTQLPADSPVMAYVDVAALRDLRSSPLAAILGLAGSETQEYDRAYTAFIRDTGFDYTRDLDRAAIAFWPAGSGDAAHAHTGQRLLVVAEGRFDQRKIAAYAKRSGAGTSSTGSIYEVPGNPAVAFKFLSSTRLALTSGNNAEELLTAPVSQARNPETQASLDQVAGAPIFAVAQVARLPKDFYENFKQVPQLERLVRSVKDVTLAGQPDGDHIGLTVDGECDSLKNALEVATLVEFSRMGASMLLADPKTKRQMTPEQSAFLGEVVSNLKVTHQDRLVRLQLDLTPAMLAAAAPVSAASAPR